MEKPNCDLHNCFGQLASGLKVDTKRAITLTAESFSEPPGFLETDQLVIRKGYTNHDDFKVDRLDFFASKSTYQELGLLILSVVFCPGGAKTHVKLTNPTSTVKNLIVEYGGETRRSFSYRTKPAKFLFLSASVETHPWTNQHIELTSLPGFRLTNLNGPSATDDDWNDGGTVIGFGNDDASVLLAELLLQFGSTESATNEVVLEGEGGFRGVGIHSAEVVFWLPGSLAWPEGVELSGLFIS